MPGCRVWQSLKVWNVDARLFIGDTYTMLRGLTARREVIPADVKLLVILEPAANDDGLSETCMGASLCRNYGVNTLLVTNHHKVFLRCRASLL